MKRQKQSASSRFLNCFFLRIQHLILKGVYLIRLVLPFAVCILHTEHSLNCIKPGPKHIPVVVNARDNAFPLLTWYPQTSFAELIFFSVLVVIETFLRVYSLKTVLPMLFAIIDAYSINNYMYLCFWKITFSIQQNIRQSMYNLCDQHCLTLLSKFGLQDNLSKYFNVRNSCCVSPCSCVVIHC